MNEYRFEDIRTGLSENFLVKVQEQDYVAFRDTTGDVSPLHGDRDYARQYGFRDKVVPGMLTSSYYSTLAGVYLPGTNALLHGIRVSFHNPAFVGDTLEVHGEVSYVNAAFKQIEIKCRITSQDGAKISSGTMKVGLRE